MKLLPPTIFSLSLLLTAAAAPAQEAVVKLTSDKNKILIGEPFQITAEASFPAKSGLHFSLPDSIAHFEKLEAPVTDSGGQNGTVTIHTRYKLTSFDSGQWVIPPFVLSNGMKTDSLRVDVVFSPFDPSQDYHDIKDVISVKPSGRRQWWWYAAGGVLLLAALLYFLLKKKRTAPPPINQAPAIGLNPYEEAMKQLAALKKETVDAKKFHSALVDILRLYVFRKKGILSLQKTTGDLVAKIKELGLPAELFEKLSRSLQLSDSVKFARYQPSEGENKTCIDAISGTVTHIEQTGSATNIEKE